MQKTSSPKKDECFMSSYDITHITIDYEGISKVLAQFAELAKAGVNPDIIDKGISYFLFSSHPIGIIKKQGDEFKINDL